MDLILYSLAEKKFNLQIAEFGQERMDAELEKLKNFAKKCDFDKNLCHRRHHKTWKDFPGYQKIMIQGRGFGEVIGEKLDRKKGIRF